MQRFLLTCAIGLGLWIALQAYSRVMTPLTRALEKPKQPPKMTSVANQPVVLDPVISDSLQDQAWIQSATLQWQRSKQAYLYAGRVEPDANSDGTSLKMSPFALVWKDEKHPDRPPMTIVARSARVRFEKSVFDTRSSPEPTDISSFNLVGQDAGRIVAAFLDGEVRITGPDHLVIDGQNFIFREETAQLYSDYEISFRYGPTENGEPVALQGKSLDGLTVSFNPAAGAPLGSDMPRIEERPKSIQLVGRVSVDFVTQESGEPTKTRVSSQGPFTYELATNTAKFSDRVLVTRPRPGGHQQELECNWLALVFSQITRDQTPAGVIPAAAQDDALDAPGLLSGVELVTVRAMAKTSPNAPQRDRMKVTSTEHGLVCELDDLNYEARRGLLTLKDPEMVDVTREFDGHSQKFEAPTIEIRHRERQLEQISGLGKGRFTYHSHPDREGTPDVWARWSERMDLIPQPVERKAELTVQGTATIRYSDEMQFSASTITATLLPLEQMRRGVLSPAPKPSRRARPPKESPVQRVVASGNVLFAGPGVVGRKIRHVDIQVVSGPIIAVSEPRRQKRASQGGEDGSSKDPESVPFVFETTRLEGVAVFDPAVEEYGIQELHGYEGVRLWREGLQAGEQEVPFEKQPIRVTSREFSAFNSGGTRQVLTLRGVVDSKGTTREPVIAKFGEFSVEGPNLTVDREKNLVTITGQGVLRFPVDQDFSGNPLSPPQLADIAFTEKAEFDGQKATCWGGVKTSVLTNVIWAEEMNAVLNQRIDFSADEPRTRNFAIDSLHCQDKVRVKFFEYNQTNVLVEVLIAELHDFDLNQKTGDFVGAGPGKIQDWRRSGTRRMLMQPNTSARANRPAEANREYQWEYVGIDFKDKLTGNIQQQWAKLNERVKLVYAPVKTAYEEFDVNDLSSDAKNAANAVWIGSEQLTVTIATQPGQGVMATVEAVHNAEMEGQLFYARAHSLQYEQAKEMFTLRGKGQDDATLNIYRDKDGTASKLPAQMIQFFPSRQEVVIDRAKTFNAVFGGESSGQ